jgi:tRNA pseudouridine38-40 synthase
MERYQLILAYDGTDFHGFQRQGKIRTVQLEVESALRKINWQGKSILAAGRTDVGVHASGQVISFDHDWRHSLEALSRALNAHLPADVSVQSVKLTREDFHPRFDALWRKYVYRIMVEGVRNPLKERYTWRISQVADLDLLQSAARLFEGTFDFSAFGAPMKIGGNTVRTVLQANWDWCEDGISFTVKANAFLYHMVRRMVFLQVMVSQNKVSLEQLEEAICQTTLQRPGLAPPNGLFLSEVGYPENSDIFEGEKTEI